MQKTNITLPHISIGIPVYNEESNIRSLIKSLLNQIQKGFVLDHIYVVSDASTDTTEDLVKSFKNKKVVLLKNKTRIGKALSQNRIFRISKGDILILLDGDIQIKNLKFIKKFIEPFTIHSRIGLVGAKVISTNSGNWFSTILDHSHSLKNQLYESLGVGNIYLCHGRARAFSKRFYKNFRFSNIASEDSESYLLCKSDGFMFMYEPKAKVYFKSPENFYDYLKQSIRFFRGKNELSKLYGKARVKREYFIPISLYIKFILKGFVINPIKTLSFSFILMASFISKAIGMIRIKSAWQISESSKKGLV